MIGAAASDGIFPRGPPVFLMGAMRGLFERPLRAARGQRPLRGLPAAFCRFLCLFSLFFVAVHANTDVNNDGGGDTGEKEANNFSAKMIAALLIFFCAVFGAIPAFVMLRRQEQQQRTGAPMTSRSSSNCTVLPSCCGSNYGAAASVCCFGASSSYVRAATVYTAGVVAAVALLHLLPAAERQLSKALEAFPAYAAWGPDYPAAALCSLVGLLLSAALEAVVEQQQQQQGEPEAEAVSSPSSGDSMSKGAALSTLFSVQWHPEQPAAAAAAAPGTRGGLSGSVGAPVSREEKIAALSGVSVEPCCCLGRGAGAWPSACDSRGVCLEIASAPPAPVGRELPMHCGFAALRQHRRCCVDTYGSSSSSSKPLEAHQAERRAAAPQLAEAAAATAPAPAAACNSNSNSSSSSSSSKVQSETPLLSCPYTLMDEEAVGSAHTQQRKAPPENRSPRATPCGEEMPQRSSAFVGGLLLAGLSVHSLLEGLTLGAATNPKTVAIAILFHKTLEAFAVGSSLLHVRAAVKSYAVQMLFYALATPLGVAGGVFLQSSVAQSPTGSVGVWGVLSPYLQLLPGLLTGLGAGAFLHVGLLEILASELQRCRRERRGDMLPMIGFTAIGAFCMALV